jgi:tetratricopeptide (TPR) repeat protein
VNGWRKSLSWPDARAHRFLWDKLAALAILIGVSTMTGIAQQTSPASSKEAESHSAVLSGTVLSAVGKPVSDASVKAEAASARNLLETKTDAAGAFAFSDLPAGSYTLTAEKAGLRARTAAIAVSEGDRKHIDLVLASSGASSGDASPSSSPAPPMSFSDQPNFTVAGVTDWTAVGGHGSDSILRTSEDLAKETLALKAQSAGHSTSIAAYKNEASESKLRAALAEAPGSFEANHRLGDFYLRAERYRESLPLLQAAYQIDPTNDGNERDLALAYERAGELQQARVHIHNLLKRENDADLDRMAGELDEKLGDPLAAVKEYQRAVSLDPSEQNYFAWGSELLLHRAVWQAAEVFRHGVKAHPKSARLLTALGTALFAGAAYDEAARNLCDASDLDRANPEPYIFMGKVEMAAPAPLPCIEAKLARFAQEKPDNSLANYLYAMAISKRQALSANKTAAEQVEDLLSKAVSLDPKCFDGYLQLGILAASQHDYEKAIQLYTKAIEANSQLGEAHYRLGVAYDRLGQREKARQEFQLHDEIEKRQAAAVERERREIKQFVVVQGQPATSVAQ